MSEKKEYFPRDPPPPHPFVKCKNGCFSIIPVGTASIDNVGLFCDTDGANKFRWSRTKVRGTFPWHPHTEICEETFQQTEFKISSASEKNCISRSSCTFYLLGCLNALYVVILTTLMFPSTRVNIFLWRWMFSPVIMAENSGKSELADSLPEWPPPYSFFLSFWLSGKTLRELDWRVRQVAATPLTVLSPF